MSVCNSNNDAVYVYNTRVRIVIYRERRVSVRRPRSVGGPANGKKRNLRKKITVIP